jgi:DNA-binding transcriptional LysR family regulator
VAFELRQLRAFVAVGEQLSFAQAARRLNIAQPALSRTVKAIEDAVGAPLLTRTTRRVQLTKAGEVFLDEARRTLLQADRTIRLARDAAEGVRGQLDIGYMDFAVHGPLMTALDSLKLEYPSLRVSLKRHRSEEQSVLVDRQQLDLGITMQHAFTPNLEIIPLTREPLRIVLPQDHPLAKWPAIPLARLAEENFVLGEPSIWRLYLRVLNDYCSRERFLPRVVCEAFESPTMFRFVGARLRPHDLSVCGRDPEHSRCRREAVCRRNTYPCNLRSRPSRGAQQFGQTARTIDPRTCCSNR